MGVGSVHGAMGIDDLTMGFFWVLSPQGPVQPSGNWKLPRSRVGHIHFACCYTLKTALGLAVQYMLYMQWDCRLVLSFCLISADGRHYQHSDGATALNESTVSMS